MRSPPFCRFVFRRCVAAVLVVLWGAQAFPQDPRLIALIVVDTQSREIAEDMQTNRYAIGGLIEKDVPETLREIRVIEGEKFKRSEVLQTIRNLNIGKQDAVLFFYSGHGYYDTTRGSFLKPPADNGAKFYLSEIRKALNQSSPRLRVCILDCCSVIPNGSLSRFAPYEGQVKKPEEPSPLFRSLFFEPSGEVIINSSKPGEYAVCRTHRSNVEGQRNYSTGSLFTSLLVDEWQQNGEPSDWAAVHTTMRRRVAEDFERFYPDGFIPLGSGKRIQQATQTVWTFRDGEPLE
ncbi:MAG: caspase family protein [Planctomycetaceae bacterium]|nr:caspase family protein [Planctomycetaceae bacterium]